jgi:hypothetical protein
MRDEVGRVGHTSCCNPRWARGRVSRPSEGASKTRSNAGGATSWSCAPLWARDGARGAAPKASSAPLRDPWQKGQAPSVGVPDSAGGVQMARGRRTSEVREENNKKGGWQVDPMCQICHPKYFIHQIGTVLSSLTKHETWSISFLKIRLGPSHPTMTLN